MAVMRFPSKQVVERALALFPARRRLRQVEAELAELRHRARDLERFRGLAMDMAGSLRSVGERAGQSAS